MILPLQISNNTLEVITGKIEYHIRPVRWYRAEQCYSCKECQFSISSFLPHLPNRPSTLLDFLLFPPISVNQIAEFKLPLFRNMSKTSVCSSNYPSPYLLLQQRDKASVSFIGNVNLRIFIKTKFFLDMYVVTPPSVIK